jgi:hypothetical protein
MKVLPHVMRNINEFNIPGNSHGYEILYFGVNLILYRLFFDVGVKNSNNRELHLSYHFCPSANSFHNTFV